LSGAGKIVSKKLDVAQKFVPGPREEQEAVGSFLKIIRNPDSVRLWSESGEQALEGLRGGLWAGHGASVRAQVEQDCVRLSLEAESCRPTRIAMRWQGDVAGVRRYLGDAWERSYGELEWRAEVPNRPMPWYFAAYDGKRTHGYGVRTRPNAFCFWTADSSGVTLWIDVRSGGVGVELGDRSLELCTVIQRQGAEGESPFTSIQSFCQAMCPDPRLISEPMYGTNDWYALYGDNSREQILEVSRMVSDLSENRENRPYSVIDAGWSPGSWEAGPYDRGNDRFGDMGQLVKEMRALGVRPGLWVRPLAAAPDSPSEWRSQRDPKALDPSHPEVLEYVRAMIAQVVEWDYDLIKHDFSSRDITGRWGFEMGPSVTADGWEFHDRSRTTAEIVNRLYDKIREGADYKIVLGCNTFSHLSAGVFELNRIGDDTSGKDWERTRRMGVNALAFRAAQQGTFYGADADVAALTADHHGQEALRWLKLLSQSGTPLFVSLDPKVLGPEEWGALRDAFLIASYPQEVAEPVDWLNSTCPAKWKVKGRKVEYPWIAPFGGSPFSG
jgi:alpha-galactosidase